MKTIEVGQVVNESKLNRFHISILLWGLIILLFDGFDLVVYGAVVPVLMKEWSLTPVQAGAMGSYALFGMMLGALICGPLADRMGRKKVILICVTVFSACTALIGFTNHPTTFGVCRFLAGLGLGGVMPNIIALMTEYAPKNKKGTLVTVMCSGYAIGGVLSALLSIGLIPAFGWESVFFIGAIPLLFLPFMYKYLPDSTSFYMKKDDHKTLGKILVKLNPGYVYHSHDQYQLEIRKENRMPIIELFKEKRFLSTFMFWLISFMTLLVMYGLNTWLPKLMVNAGYPLGSSLMFLCVLNAGAILGSVFGGWLSDRWNPKKVLILYYLASCLSFALLGFKTNMVVLYILVAIAGATTIGSQIVFNVYVSQYYPSYIRSTGVGWSLGVGRFGGVLGPTLGGILVAMNLPFQVNFLAFGIPAVMAALAVALIQDKYGNLHTQSALKEQEQTHEIA